MFTNYHLAISREEYNDIEYRTDPSLNIEEIAPDFKKYLTLLVHVGNPWGWDRRPKYANDSENLRTRVEHGRLHLLKKFNDVTGYCLSVKRKDLTSEFNRKSVAEIENFGLFPEHNAKGYGRTFLPLIFNELFKTSDMIYLSTRSTNHPKVIPFYQSLGMKIIRQETLEDDLLVEPPKWYMN